MAEHRTSDPSGFHDWFSADYVDDWIRQDVTRDEERRPLLHRVATLLPIPADVPVRILDVGGGYGLLTAEVLRAFPRGQVVLHDFSEPMLAHARDQLAPFADRIAYRLADLRDPAWISQVDGPYDAVVSSIAIHNVRDPRVIRRIYADIWTLVRPGGCFVNIDYLVPGGPRMRTLYRRASGQADDSDQRSRQRPASSTTPAEPEPATLEHQLRWLHEAGFVEVDCLWKDLRHGVLCAFRAEEP